MSATPTKNAAYRNTTIFRSALARDERGPHKVCTVWPSDVFRPHDALGQGAWIPGRPAQNAPPQPGARNNRYGFFLVQHPGIERQDLGECQTLAIIGITAKRLAMDLIGLAEPGYSEDPSPTGELVQVSPPVLESDWTKKGYFVPEGDDPTDEEIATAEAKRDAWFEEAVRKGDNVWNSTGQTNRIAPDSLLAVRYLGLKREWAPSFQDARSRVEILCPVCRQTIEKGVRKCSSCHEWLDYDETGEAFALNDPRRSKDAKKAATVAARLGGGEG